jgi:hypothetical protein
MSRKTMVVLAPLGLGALVLLWAGATGRGDQELKPARAERKTSPAVRPEAALPGVSPVSVSSVAPAPAAASGGGEFSVIESRIRMMEEKLLALETKRDALAADNRDLERQIAEKNAEFSARNQAEFRVRALEQLLGLSETQKQSLLELWTQWIKADAGRPAGKDTWQSREGELRSRLSAEQAARLHDSASKQSETMWNHLGRSIASMAGAPKEDHSRFQQTLGTWRAPESLLLPEAHGADWPGMMREGTARLQSLLSADQMARLSRYVNR